MGQSYKLQLWDGARAVASIAIKASRDMVEQRLTLSTVESRAIFNNYIM